MKSLLYPVLLFVLLISSCTNQEKSQGESEGIYEDKNLPILQSTLYHQSAAEMRALAYQAFNVARLRVDESLEEASGKEDLAVILDLDETVLDNSPFEVRLILEGASYPRFWAEWIQQEEARAIPGALEFLNYADKKGIALFYVSNRHDSLRKHTLANLKKLDFPQAEEEQLLLKTTTSGKERRREKVAANHDIILLLGDNLNDFSEVFEGGSVDERFVATDSLRNAFGKRFIVLPNAMYGEWEGAAIDYNYGASKKEKLRRKLERLRSFEE